MTTSSAATLYCLAACQHGLSSAAYKPQCSQAHRPLAGVQLLDPQQSAGQETRRRQLRRDLASLYRGTDTCSVHHRRASAMTTNLGPGCKQGPADAASNMLVNSCMSGMHLNRSCVCWVCHCAGQDLTLCLWHTSAASVMQHTGPVDTQAAGFRWLQAQSYLRHTVEFAIVIRCCMSMR